MRTVFLLPEAYAAVLEYVARRGADDCPALFVANIEARRRLTRAAAWDGHRELRRRLPDQRGMVHFSSSHVARHTLATALSAATRDARIVQEILGHRSMNSQRVYTEIADKRKRQTYATGSRFSELLHGTGP